MESHGKFSIYTRGELNDTDMRVDYESRIFIGNICYVYVLEVAIK